jgi:hypothetical protein
MHYLLLKLHTKIPLFIHWVAHSHEVKFCNSFPGFTENRRVEEKSMYKEVCSFKQLDLY